MNEGYVPIGYNLDISDDEYLEVKGEARDGKSILTIRLFSRSSGHVLDIPMDGPRAVNLSLAIQVVTAEIGLKAGKQRMRMENADAVYEANQARNEPARQARMASEQSCPECGEAHGPRGTCYGGFGDPQDGPSEMEILGNVGDR